jgi:hypothetical protein
LKSIALPVAARLAEIVLQSALLRDGTPGSGLRPPMEPRAFIILLEHIALVLFKLLTKFGEVFADFLIIERFAKRRSAAERVWVVCSQTHGRRKKKEQRRPYKSD